MDNDIGKKNLAVFAAKAVIIGIVVGVVTLVVWPRLSPYEKCLAWFEAKGDSRNSFYYCIGKTSW